MGIEEIVSVSIGSDSVGVQRAGFGVALILSANAAFSERIRYYTSIAGVAVDFATTTPEYLMATALFSQSVKPTRIAIGRCANKPTQKYSIIPTVANAHVYTVSVNGHEYSYTSDGSATNDEIVDALVTAINAGTGDTTTATGPGSSGSHVLTLTGNTTGAFDSVSIDEPDFLSLAQDHADPGLSADLDAIALENPDFYFVLYPYNSKACILAIAAWAEANDRLYVAATADTKNATLAVGSDSTTSPMGQLKTSAYARTAAIYHPEPSEFADAAWVGRVGPLDPGSETWAFKTLAGVAAVTMTATHITNIKAKRGNYYNEVAGVNITRDGKVSANEYIDVIRFRDWLKAQIEEAIFGHLAAADKIPFTDAGVAIIESDVRAQLTRGVTVGGLAADPAPSVTVPAVADVSDLDKQDRTLPDVKFTATLAGAIQAVTITGVVSV